MGKHVCKNSGSVKITGFRSNAFMELKYGDGDHDIYGITIDYCPFCGKSFIETIDTSENLESVFNDEILLKNKTAIDLCGKEFHPKYLDSCFILLEDGRWILRFVKMDPIDGLSSDPNPNAVVMNGSVYTYSYLYKEVKSVTFEK